MSVTLDAAFEFRERVVIDGDPSLRGHVTAIMFRNSAITSPSYEVSYFHNGQPVTAWVEEWRLEAVP